jgi:hypothetical protein
MGATIGEKVKRKGKAKQSKRDQGKERKEQTEVKTQNRGKIKEGKE